MGEPFRVARERVRQQLVDAEDEQIDRSSINVDGESVQSAMHEARLASRIVDLEAEVDRLRAELAEARRDLANSAVMFNDEVRWRNEAQADIERRHTEREQARTRLERILDVAGCTLAELVDIAARTVESGRQYARDAKDTSIRLHAARAELDRLRDVETAARAWVETHRLALWIKPDAKLSPPGVALAAAVDALGPAQPDEEGSDGR